MNLVPVDNDPFSDGAPGAPMLVPVDHDPFADNSTPAPKAKTAAVDPNLTDLPAAGVAGDGAAAIGRNLIGGIPIVGGAALDAVNRGVAHVRAYKNDTPYEDELQRVRNFGTATAEANPGAALAGSVGGGVLGTAPLIAAAPAAFGAGGGGLGLRSLQALASGTAIGGADAAGQALVGKDGYDPSAVAAGGVAKGAAAGGALGAAGPAAGSLVGAGARKFYSMIGERFAPSSGFSRGATGLVAEDAANSGGVGAVRDQIAKNGPNGMLLDVGDFQGSAQGLAVRPETRSIIQTPLVARQEGATARFGGDVDAALGPSQFSPRELDAHIKQMRQPHNDEIGAVTRAADPIDVAPLMHSIDRRLQTAVGGEEAALKRAREMLTRRDPLTNESTIESNPQRLQNVKQELDNMINYGAPDIGIQPGSLTRKDGAVRGIRGELNEHLRTGIPGYAAANDQSAALARQADALEKGYRETFRGGPDVLFPQDLSNVISGAKAGEQDAIRQAMAAGNRADIARIMGTNRNDVTALRNTFQGEGGFNRDKVGLLHGEQAAQALDAAMEREAAFALSHHNIVANSQTAQRQGAAARFAPKDTLGNDLGTTLAGITGGATGVAASLGARGAKAAVNAASREMDIARNREVARALTLNQGDQLERLLAAIQARDTIAQQATGVGQLAGNAAQAGLLSQQRDFAPYVPMRYVTGSGR
jgi:hypothetical protein